LGDIDVVRCCAEDVRAAECKYETLLRAFAREGDDEEVQAVFARHADQARLRCETLQVQIAELESKTAPTTQSPHILPALPKLTQGGHVAEEQLVKNLIACYSIQVSACAMYEVLSAVASAAGDESTRNLAQRFQAELAQSAQQIWRLIPSRSKIAYNVLTVGEIDPAIATRAAENRVR
jgi:ferritin-like metal-binding protein YciE